MREDWDNKPLAVEVVEGCVPEIGRMVWLLEVARQRLQERLAGLEQGVIDFAMPHENSIGTLLYHIAAIEVDWLYTEVLESSPFAPELAELICWDVRDGSGRLTVVNGRSLEEHLHVLDRARHYLLQTFRQMDLADFRRVRHFENYSCTPEWVLHHLIQHETEHRGQIMTIRTQAERAAISKQ
ncbi:MAG: DinB family protein [Ardenticatenaceae bacterium]|nr:DinB family protein [Ardenticatenaceae bacterium]